MTTRSYDMILPPGTHASLPTSAPRGTLRPCTTDGKIHQWDGAAWTDWRGSPSFATQSDVDLTGLANGNVPVYDSTAGKWKPGTGGAGSSPRTIISNPGPLGSASATITFSSIPSTYDDLEVVLVGKHSASTISVNVVLNGATDTGSNYKREILFGATGTPSAGSSSSNAAMAIAATESRSVLTLSGYKSTTRFKTVSVRSDLPEDFGIYLYGLTWLNNAAVTSISLVCSSGSFAAGTTPRLYGLKDV